LDVGKGDRAMMDFKQEDGGLKEDSGGVRVDWRHRLNIFDG
jgi:hypothetical protein